MQDILKNLPLEKQQPRAWIGLIILLVYLSSFVIINVISSSLVEIDDQFLLSQDPISLLVSQAVSQFFMFIVVGIIISYLLLKFDILDFFPAISWTAIGLIIVITIGSMVVLSAVGEWNMNLEFGESTFGEWARASEDTLKKLTEQITNFNSVGHFLLAVLAIAIIPAIGEELIFRGLIQGLLVRLTRNPHVAIWITGFIFAAIHLQFFGLAPRMLLGVLFGYLYHWSGKLSTAVIGHLVNNGTALILLFLVQNNTVELTPDQMEQSAPWPAIVFFTILTGFLLFQFKKYYTKNA